MAPRLPASRSPASWPRRSGTRSPVLNRMPRRVPRCLWSHRRPCCEFDYWSRLPSDLILPPNRKRKRDERYSRPGLWSDGHGLVLTSRSARTSASMVLRRWAHAADQHAGQRDARDMAAGHDDRTAARDPRPYHPGARAGLHGQAGREASGAESGHRQQVARALRQRGTGRAFRRAALRQAADLHA